MVIYLGNFNPTYFLLKYYGNILSFWGKFNVIKILG